MNLYYHIAKQFFSSLNDIGSITKKISIIGIGLGSFALIISISVLNGFEQKLDEKISNFDGHIRISGIEQRYDISDIELLEGIISTSFSLDRKGIINHSSNQSVVTFKQVDYNKIKSFYKCGDIAVTQTLKGNQNDAKASGSLFSYGYKYLLQKFFLLNIEESQDLDFEQTKSSSTDGFDLNKLK